MKSGRADQIFFDPKKLFFRPSKSVFLRIVSLRKCLSLDLKPSNRSRTRDREDRITLCGS